MMKVIVGIVVGVAVGIMLPVSVSTPGVVVCWEDEVITASGACHPLDDSDYVGGVGWVAR